VTVRYAMETGWPSQLGLRRRISAYARTDRASGFKIGITSNPEQRMSNYGRAYTQMVVLYQTSSDRLVRGTESQLIDYHWDYSDNQAGGGAGTLGSPPYYLYVVMR